MQHCSHGELMSVSCVLLHSWHLLYTVHRNSNFTYDNLVTIAAAVLSGPILGATSDTAILPQGRCGTLCEAGNISDRGMHCASNVHLHSVHILPGLQGTLAPWQEHSDC